MIASAFQHFAKDDYNIIFASGVSNSGETDPIQFDREKKLLEKTLSGLQHQRLIYFSSYSVTHKMSPYTFHKLEMEKIISTSRCRYIIFRPSNVVGISTNPYTFLNYFTNRIKNQLPVTIQYQCQRNLIGIEDLNVIISEILSDADLTNKIINIGYPYSYPVSEIVSSIEQYFNTAVTKNLSEVEEFFEQSFFDTSVLKRFVLKPREHYLQYLLSTYFPKAQ
ncbi:MAG: NAD-dependent epimerase/dehydratase family protein [Saprospiraceae bacterium]